LIRETKDLEKQINDLKAQYIENKQIIQNIFDKEKLKEYIVPADKVNGKDIIVKRTERVTIEYLVDKLKQKLSKEIMNEITIKMYMITAMPRLIKLCKMYNVPVETFKECIQVEETINKDAIKQLYEVGDITHDDIAGCFKATLTKNISIKYRGKGDSD